MEYCYSRPGDVETSAPGQLMGYDVGFLLFTTKLIIVQRERPVAVGEGEFFFFGLFSKLSSVCLKNKTKLILS